MIKRFILLVFALFVTICCNAQNNIQINIDGNGNNNQQCPLRINGICSTEDIGGVGFERTNIGTAMYSIDGLAARNYNPFPVTVLVEITEYVYNNYVEKKIIRTYKNVYTIILKPDEKKAVMSFNPPSTYTLISITRRLGGY